MVKQWDQSGLFGAVPAGHNRKRRQVLWGSGFIRCKAYCLVTMVCWFLGCLGLTPAVFEGRDTSRILGRGYRGLQISLCYLNSPVIGSDKVGIRKLGYVNSFNCYVGFLSKGLFKDRHQWCSLSLSMDELFPKAMKYVIYH